MAAMRLSDFYEICEEVRIEKEMKEYIAKLPPEIQQALRELRQAANGYKSKGGDRR